MTRGFLTFVFALFMGLNALIAQHAIIPQPVNMEAAEGSVTIESEIGLILDQENELITTMLANFTSELKPLGIKVSSDSGAESTAAALLRVTLKEEDSVTLGKEGYELHLANGVINLQAIEPAGVFNGLQTFRQLLPQKRVANEEGNYEPVLIEGMRIVDYPRFGWRGLMLDVSRHFFTVEEVKDYIDQMSKYKFNVFHWHLTDDEGWRIEIKAFPRLTEVGAWRVERHGRFGSQRPYPKKNEKATYGGFYTQEQVKEVIAYAAARNVTIIPEIDVPGHSMALLAAYPELSTRKELKFVNPGSKFANWFDDGTFEMTIENTLDPSNPAVYAFLDMIFGEIADLFPADYIHMGGDECYHGYWERDEKVQAFMKKNEIKDSHELQSYFVKRVEKIISGKGKKMIGWDEILEGGLADGAAVMSWRGMQGGIEAARSQHEVVMTPKEFVYLDYTQGDYSVENKIYDDLSLEKAYSFDPMPNPNLFVDIDPELILGGQGNLWTEVIPTLQYAYYMTYPRAFALSEALWSPHAVKDYKNFLARTETHFDRFDQAGRSIAKTIYEPEVKVKMESGKLMCTLRASFDDIEFRYTIDNTYPVGLGKKYTEAFAVPEGDLKLRAQSYRNGQPIGRMLIIDRKDLEARAK